LPLAGGAEQPPSVERLDKASTLESVESGVGTLAAPTPLSPSDPKWGRTDFCTADAEFVAITAGVDARAPLWSRHVGCASLVSDPQPVRVATMLKADGSGYEFCKRAAGRNCNYEVAGYATFRTYWQVYGAAAGGTNKTYALQTRIVRWT
jgi:hypothetical protein